MYRKGVKSLFILVQLMGVNYIFVYVQPSRPLWFRVALNYYSCLVYSTQGALVALLFCFRNNEVCMR
jgi:hypothetical protein